MDKYNGFHDKRERKQRPLFYFLIFEIGYHYIGNIERNKGKRL